MQPNTRKIRTLMEWDQVQHQPMQKEIGRNFIRLANTVERKDILHSDVRKDLMLSAVSVIKWVMKLLFAKTGINHIMKLQRLLIRRRSTSATCFSSIKSSQNWLIYNGYTNHRTNNKDLFQEPSNISTLKVRVGNDLGSLPSYSILMFI